MPKGQDKPGHNKKKPKQEKSSAPKSAYAQAMAGKVPAPTFDNKKK